MTGARQLPLAMPPRDALGPDDFARGPANAEALATLAEPARWPRGRLALVAPEGAGKTHLVTMLFAAAPGAVIADGATLGSATPEDLATRLAAGMPVVVEDADRLAGDGAGEAALFHLYNLVTARDGRLLLTARSAPAAWPVRLPDLASRLATLGVVRIAPPDEGLIAAVMLKAAEDRGLDLAPEAVEYLLPRMERAFGAVHALIAALDARALGRRRRHVSRRLAADCLAESLDPAAAARPRGPGASETAETATAPDTASLRE